MKLVKYILVNETGSQSAADAVRCSRVSDFRHCIVVNPIGLSHGELIDQLVRLRHYPDAKILGLSELPSTGSGTYPSHAPIRVSPEMNRLRRELSDLP